MSRKKPPRFKHKKKRNRKYKGAAKQSAKDKKLQNYKPAMDYLTSYNSNINSLSSQLREFKSSIYQPSFLNAMTGIQNSLSSMNVFESKLPILNNFNLVSPALDFSRQATLTYSQLSSQEIVNGLGSLVMERYPDWYKETIVKGSVFPKTLLSPEEIVQSSQSLVEMLGAQNVSAFSVQSNLANSMKYSLYSEKSLSTFPWNDLGDKIVLNKTSKELIGNSFLGLSSDYTELLESYKSNRLSYVELDPVLSKLAPVEYYTSASFLESISIDEEITAEEELIKNEIVYENEYSLTTYLPQIHSGLMNMWKGAIETFNSNNSDKVRQFTVSLRELFTHLLHLLAPNEEIIKWTNDTSFFHQGKPTRKARLYYICRNISNIPFNKFVEKDIEATLAFIDIFQDGTHNIESGITLHQLIAMKSKAESNIKFILEIEFSANRKATV